MLRFAYTAMTDSGRKVSGVVLCADRHEALTQLCGKGYHPLGIDAVHEGGGRLGGLLRKWRNRVSTSQLALATRQLSSLLRAGLPVVEALATLARQAENRKVAAAVTDVRETLLQDGGTLAGALACRQDVFNPVYRSLVRSGEEGGQLPEVLGQLSGHLARSAKLRGQVVGALIYPAFLMLLGSTAIAILMTFVIPGFRELFDSFGRQLPAPTQTLIAVSDFTSRWWWALLAGLAAVGLAAVALLRQVSVRTRTDRLLLRLPILGKMCLKLAVCRIARTLSSLVAGGVSIVEALRITRDTVRNLAVKGTFQSMVVGILQGDALATAAGKSGLYPPLMVNLIRTGEETGELPEMLSELAAIYEDEAERAVSGAVKLLEPILIVVMGAVIAGIVAAVMLPVFQANVMVE